MIFNIKIIWNVIISPLCFVEPIWKFYQVDQYKLKRDKPILSHLYSYCVEVHREIESQIELNV